MPKEPEGTVRSSFTPLILFLIQTPPIKIMTVCDGEAHSCCYLARVGIE